MDTGSQNDGSTGADNNIVSTHERGGYRIQWKGRMGKIGREHSIISTAAVQLCRCSPAPKSASISWGSGASNASNPANEKFINGNKCWNILSPYTATSGVQYGWAAGYLFTAFIHSSIYSLKANLRLVCISFNNNCKRITKQFDTHSNPPIDLCSCIAVCAFDWAATIKRLCSDSGFLRIYWVSLIKPASSWAHCPQPGSVRSLLRLLHGLFERRRAKQVIRVA